MDGQRILQAIELLQQEIGIRIPRWKKAARTGLQMLYVAMAWIASIWIIKWLKNGA